MDYKLTLVTPAANFSIDDMESFFSMIKKQTNQNFECILVLNGEKSTIDKALSTLKACNVPNNVSTIIDNSNTYIGGARNCGINHAKGNYISFVDLDDALNESFVDITYNLIKSNVDAIVYNYSIVLTQANGVHSTCHRKIIKEEEIVSGQKASELCVKKEINKPCWNKVFRKEILKNPFFINCNGEDYCMPLIFKSCNRVYLSTFDSYIYRLNSTSSSHKSDYENCFYSLVLSAIILNDFGLPFIESIMSLNKEDFYKNKIVFKALNIKSKFKIVNTFYKQHKKCLAGKFNFKLFILLLLSKMTLASKFVIKIKKESIYTTRMKAFIDLYLNEAILSFEKFK